MADQDETMRIVAEIVDKFSKPLRDFRKELRESTAYRGDPRLQRSFEQVRRTVDDLRGSIRSTMATIGALTGVTLTAAGAVAVLKSSVLGFSQSTVALSHLRRETGVTINYMRQLEALGERVGSSAEAMRGGVSQFSRNMQELRSGTGSTLETFFTKGDARVRQFAQSLRGVGSNEEALKRVLQFLDRIPRAVDKQRFLEAFGLPAELGRLSGPERERALEEIRRNLGSTSKEAEGAAKQIEEALAGIREQWTGLQNDIASSGALEAIRDVLSGLRDFMAENKGEFGKGISDFFKSIAPTARDVAETFKSIKDTIQWIKDTANSGADWLNWATGKGGKKREPIVDLPEAFRKGDDFIKRNSGVGSKIWDFLTGGPEGSDKQPPIGIVPPKGIFSGPQDREIKEGTKEGASEGIQDGLRKMMLERSTGGGDFGGARVWNASLGGGGSRGGFAGGGRSAGASPMGEGATAGATDLSKLAVTNETLAADRTKFAEELKQKPWLTRKILGISLGENKNPAANASVIESMMNRASVRGTSLEEAALLHSSAGRRVSPGDAGRGGYYAGYDPAALNRPKLREMAEENLRKALGGSNVSNYATDNASQGLAERNKATGRFRAQSEYGRETFFSPGTAGGRGGPASRARYEAWRSALASQEAAREANRKRMMGGAAAAGGLGGKVEGDASLRIDLNGFPAGTRTEYTASGLFKDVELNRGRVAPIASEVE